MLGLLESFKASFKPFTISLISIPANAHGNKPTGVIAENLPPMSSGILNVFQSFFLANERSVPLLASVTATTLSLAPSAPYFSNNNL